jgi:hypothetical protein
VPGYPVFRCPSIRWVRAVLVNALPEYRPRSHAGTSHDHAQIEKFGGVDAVFGCLSRGK